MSTRLSDITRESDLAQESFVDTQDLDPDPANGLKNENQQRGEIRNQGPVRQQPIRVPMDQPQQIPFPNRPQIPFPNQPQSEGLRDFLTDIVTERQVPEGVLGGPAAPVSPIPLPAIRNYQRVGQNSVLLGLRQGLQNPLSGFGTKQIQQNEPGFTPVQNLRDATIEGQVQKANRELNQLQTAGRSLLPDLPDVSVPQAAPPGVTQSGFAPIPNLPPQQQNQGFTQIGDPATTQVQQLQSNPGLFERVTEIQTAPPGLTGGPPVAFDPRTGAGLLSGDITLADAPLVGQFIDEQQRQQFRDQLDLPPSPPLVGPAGVGVSRAESVIGRAASGVRSLPQKLRITGQRGQQQLTRPLELAQRAGQRAQQAAGRIRAPQGVTGPPQRPGDILARQPVGSGGGGGGVGPEMMRISRLQDVAMQQRRLERLRAAQEAQAAAAQRAGQVQQTGLTALGLGGAEERLRAAQQSGLTQFQGPPGVMEDLSVPAQPAFGRLQQAQQQEFDQLSRPELTGFGAEITRPDIRQFDPTIQRQFGGLQQTPLQRPGITPGLQQRQLARLGQPQLNIQDQIQTPQFPPITTTIPQPQVPPRTPRIGIPPTPPLRIPGVPPPPVPFGAGGGGVGGAGTRRRFPFGRIREFSPAFPGTSFRVLPDGTVVLDLDPGERRRSNGQQPRDPNTGQFVSSGG